MPSEAPPDAEPVKSSHLPAPNRNAALRREDFGDIAIGVSMLMH
jgi:hypothetical protein